MRAFTQKTLTEVGSAPILMSVFAACFKQAVACEGGFLNPPSHGPHGLGRCQLPPHSAGGRQWPFSQAWFRVSIGQRGWAGRMGGRSNPLVGRFRHPTPCIPTIYCPLLAFSYPSSPLSLDFPRLVLFPLSLSHTTCPSSSLTCAPPQKKHLTRMLSLHPVLYFPFLPCLSYPLPSLSRMFLHCLSCSLTHPPPHTCAIPQKRYPYLSLLHIYKRERI